MPNMPGTANIAPQPLATQACSNWILVPSVEDVVIETDVQSWYPCRLVVMSDRDTVVDRGVVTQLSEKQTFEGSFRFWEESSGRVLYVYDDTQSLVTRVINPTSVTVVEVLETVE